MDHPYEDNTTDDEVKILITLNQQMLQAEEDDDSESLARLLTEDFTIIRASGVKQDRQAFLDAVPDNANRGRSAAEPDVYTVGECAVYTVIVTTTQDADGTPNPGRFWNTRMFLKENGQWGCAGWQVTGIT